MGTTRNIDTLRILATFLLVAYHVIGIGAAGGMEVADSSLWRFAADLLVDIRMPLFAFIAGCVYALRPIALGNIGGFIIGKTRRLVIPGIVAALVFWVLGNFFFSGAFSSGAPLYDAVTLSYGHFWFLQAILLLFMTVGILDAALRYRAALPMLLVACIVNLGWDYLGLVPPSPLELDRAVNLAPGFLMGIVAIRHGAALQRSLILLATIASVLLILGLWLNLEVYFETGRLSRNRMDLQSLMVATGGITLLYMVIPQIAWCDRIAPMAFTIYLYHPLGTSFARRLFELQGVESDLVRFFGGMVIGFAVPIAIHVLASRFEPSRRLLLGLRVSARSRLPSEGDGAARPN